MMRMMGSLIILLALGCVSPGTDQPKLAVQPETVRSATRFQKEYVLASGDQIEIYVRRFPEVSRIVIIRPDGFITLPIAGDQQAAGLTPRELARALTEELSGRLLEPDVTVIPLVVRQPVVFVTGDVTNTAVVPLRDAPTAMQAITFAGGFRRTAAVRDVVIIRLDEDGYLVAIPVGVEAQGQAAPILALHQIILAPDDILFVPESGRSQIARALDDFVQRPLSGLNALVGTYVNFQLIDALTD